jgi:hypothetical protein
MRQFRDAAGVEWQVYQTERTVAAERRRDHLLPAAYREGWLVFESAREKRRLAPVPAGWSELSDDALAALCAKAAVQPRGAKRGEQPTDEPVGAKLSAVEERLTDTLNEVCDTPEVEKLDTGELIRVEETLAIAAETAKQAVSLRRKRHSQVSQKEQREPEARE